MVWGEVSRMGFGTDTDVITDLIADLIGYQPDMNTFHIHSVLSHDYYRHYTLL